MNILVTGGSGSIGRWVVQELQTAHHVTIFDLQEPLPTEAAFVPGSITDFTAVQAVALRFCWVWQPETYPHRERILAQDGELNVKRHFGYVDVRDVAAACRLAAEAEGLGYEALFITADDTYAEEPTLELIRRHYRRVPRVSDIYLADPYRGLFDNNRAKKVLGWQPRYHWRDRDTPRKSDW